MRIGRLLFPVRSMARALAKGSVADRIGDVFPWRLGSCLLLVFWAGSAPGANLAGPVTNSANAHIYYLLSASDWSSAQNEARKLGGHLATINDVAEQNWVSNMFSSWGGVRRHLWIGLYDANKHLDASDMALRRQEFLWISGEQPSYRNWSPVEPSDSGGREEAIHMWSPNNLYAGQWNDADPALTNLFGDPLHGVVEVNPSAPLRGEDLVNATGPSVVFHVQDTTRKISQLVGDYDRHLQEPTENLTQTRYGLASTDLGAPFSHDGRTYILFGDSFGPVGADRDTIAYSTDTNAADGLEMTFLTNGNVYRPITIPGISQNAFEVPTDGVSVNNRMYIYHTTDHSTPVTMGRSVVAVSEDNGLNFRLLYSLSRRHFINVSVEKVNLPSWPGFPQSFGEGLVIFGSGRYRGSNIRLAFQPAAQIESPSAIRYFAGLDRFGVPTWSSAEFDAISLFDQPCVGEFSVAYNRFVRKWILLYNCHLPRGVTFRTADQPWGPWSEPQILFEPWADGGYCAFMHVAWTSQNCDSVHDPGRENDWAGEYGPYMFDQLATGTENRTTIYFTMSTWNPYTVVLMQSDLVRSNLSTVLPLVSTRSVWRYRDDGSNQGTAWRGTNFNDSAWRAGGAQLGFGDNDERTVINGGPDGARHITSYFRHSWFVPDASAYSNLSVRLLRDDGGVVYLNGREVFRSNMPAGAVAYNTPALSAVGGSDEARLFATNVDPRLLMTGTNVLAVEIHQVNSTSSDLSFDVELAGQLAAPRLSIERAGTGTRLSWQFPSSGYILEGAARPDDAVWTPMPNAVTIANGQKAVTDSTPSSSRFYRLLR